MAKPARPAKIRTPEPEPQNQLGFLYPAMAALGVSVLAAALVAILSTDAGRELAADLDAPILPLVTVPVIIAAALIFVASLISVVVPETQQRVRKLTEFALWMIPAWLVFSGVVIGAMVWVLRHVA